MKIERYNGLLATGRLVKINIRELGRNNFSVEGRGRENALQEIRSFPSSLAFLFKVNLRIVSNLCSKWRLTLIYIGIKIITTNNLSMEKLLFSHVLIKIT